MRKQQKLLKTEKSKILSIEAQGQVLNESLWKFLDEKVVFLWSQGHRKISLLDVNDNLVKSLAFARRCGSVRIGLEQIQTILQTEEAGLKLMNNSSAQKKANSTLDVGENISRLLIVSNDGSERFYRGVEALLDCYSHRLLGIKVNVDAFVLGRIYYGKEKAVKAFLINKKDLVLRVLSSLN